MDAIPCGPPTQLVQNQVYALPAKTVWLVATAALTFSNLPASGFAAASASTTGMQSSWAFCSCSAATNCVVTVKSH